MFVLESENTITATVEFRDSLDTLIDLSDTYAKIYDAKKTLILTDTDNVERVSQGIYSYSYETDAEAKPSIYYIEIGGTYNSKKVLSREPFQTKFDVVSS